MYYPDQKFRSDSARKQSFHCQYADTFRKPPIAFCLPYCRHVNCSDAFHRCFIFGCNLPAGDFKNFSICHLQGLLLHLEDINQRVLQFRKMEFQLLYLEKFLNILYFLKNYSFQSLSYQ